MVVLSSQGSNCHNKRYTFYYGTSRERLSPELREHVDTFRSASDQLGITLIMRSGMTQSYYFLCWKPPLTDKIMTL